MWEGGRKVVYHMLKNKGQKMCIPIYICKAEQRKTEKGICIDVKGVNGMGMRWEQTIPDRAEHASRKLKKRIVLLAILV